MNRRQKEAIQSQLNDEKEILKRLKEIYEQAQKDIEYKIAALLARKDEENLQSIIYQLDYQRALKAQINAILDALNTQQFESISKYLVECYENGFLGTLYDLQGQGIPLVFPIDQEQVVKAITHDTKLSKKLYTKLGEDVNELKKKVRAELSRGIAQSYSYAEIARNIRNQTSIGINRAIRIARTEGHRITTQATFDAQHKAKDAGADVVKQWDSTLDGRTRPLHRQLDGQIRELDEPFEIGGHKAQYPSGFGRASMDVNCRCVLLQVARWELEEDSAFTKRDNFSKELESFGSRADYDEFKKAFFSPENVEYMNYVYTLEERYGTKNFNTILASMSEQEYKHYSELLKNNPLYNAKAGGGKSDEASVSSFATELAGKTLSPHWSAYKTFEEYREAQDKFVGEKTDYIEDVLPGTSKARTDWNGYDEKIPQIEHTIAELQKRYPLAAGIDREFGATIRHVTVCDYDNAHYYLPDGDQDRRLTDDAVGQVFINDDRAVIAFGRNRMYQSLDEVLEERAKAIASGTVLPAIGGGSLHTVVIHEWGHTVSNHIANAMIYNDETAVEYWEWYKSLSKDEISHGISKYATTNRGEFEAECFAELQLPNPRPIAVKFGEFVAKIFEKGY